MNISEKSKGSKNQSYQNQLDFLIEQLNDHYINLLSSAKIDPNSSHRDGFENNVHAFQLVVSAQNLLKLIKELKYISIIGDYDTRNTVTDTEEDILTKRKDEAEKLLQKLKSEASSTLFELENEYYKS